MLRQHEIGNGFHYVLSAFSECHDTCVYSFHALDAALFYSQEAAPLSSWLVLCASAPL